MKLRKHILSFIAVLAVTFMAVESAVALEAPANLKATVDGNKVTLNWDDVSGATGYKLYYGYSSGNYNGNVDVGNVTSQIFENIPKLTYYVAVTAYDGIEESGFSNETDLAVYEPDDTFEQANIIILNDTAQKHNFHDAGDQDWVKFYAISGEWYSIEALNVSAVTDVVIELYDTDGATLLDVRNDWWNGEGEFLSWQCPTNGVYFIKLKNNNPDEFGPNFTYEVHVYFPHGPLGSIVGRVTDELSGLPLEGARLRSNVHGSAITWPDGVYDMRVPADTHNITCTYEGYDDAIVEGVIILEIATKVINISITTVDVLSPVINIKANGSDGPVTIQQSDNLTITISLDPKDLQGKNSDWWMTAKTPFAPPNDRYYYNLKTDWTPGITFTHQGPLFDLSPFEVLNMSGLPAGTYIFTFEVDTSVNGIKDDPRYSDSITVNVQ